MIRHPVRHRAVRSVATVALLGVLALTACADAEVREPPSPGESAAPPASPADPVTPTAPPGPALEPQSSATANLPHFTAVIERVWASEARAAGRAYVDELVAGGFERADMQVTNDTTTIGDPAESIQVSVLWGDECLIGQVGPATGSPVTAVAPALDSGPCLIGQTRPIDW